MGLAHQTPCPPATAPQPFPPGKVPSGPAAFKPGFVLPWALSCRRLTGLTRLGLVHLGPRSAVWSSKGGREWP